jgi:hypothetical protein
MTHMHVFHGSETHVNIEALAEIVSPLCGLGRISLRDGFFCYQVML